MSDLTPALQSQINDEADEYGFVVPYNNSKSFYIEDKVKGYTAGAEKYAEKWQASETDKAKLNRMLKSAVDTGKKAIERAERYEKALKLIEQMSDPGDYYKAICDMKAIASNALSSKPTTNDKR